MTSTIASLSHMNVIRCPCHNSLHLIKTYTMAYVSFQLMCLLWWRCGILAEKALDSDHWFISLILLTSMYIWIWCWYDWIRHILVQFRRNIYHHLRFDIIININRHVMVDVVEKIWRKSKRFHRKNLFSAITRA